MQPLKYEQHGSYREETWSMEMHVDHLIMKFIELP